MAVPLPDDDDVLREILVRVKDAPAALFRCAAVCKRWRGLIADLSFLRRCWPPGSGESSSFQGFFHRGTSTSGLTYFFPAPRSVLGGGCRDLSSFVPSAPAGLLDGTMLASRHGLLLLLAGCPEAGQLVVCNPVAGTFDLLPPLEWGIHCEGHAIAILTGADCRRPLQYYKVLVIDIHLNVYMFSSDEPSWSRISGAGVEDIVFPYAGDAVVRCGTVHWLWCNLTASCLCTIDVNSETGHVSTKKLVMITEPHEGGQPCLSLAADGNRTLSVLWMRTEHLQVEIWKQDSIDEEEDDDVGDDTSTWHCTRVIELKQPHEEIGRMSFILGEKCGTLLVKVKDRLERTYFAHLETGVMEEVMDCRRHNLAAGEVLAFEIDWLAFFASRLGSR